MGAFDQITNQRRAAAVLQRTILADRVSHAWLFCGPSASDMQALALAFAMTLQCTERPEDSADACMACRSCRQAMDGNHPDILFWNHEKAATFSVDEVRTLVQDVSIRPFGGGRKIYIVPDAHLMRPEAQNALLKTLEEPPEYVVILLLSQSADAMLETVRSRCQMVELAAGRAGYEPAIRRIAEDLLLQVPGLELPGIRTAVKELEPFRLQADQILELFASWYRDILYFKASGDPEGIRFQEHSGQIRSASEAMSYEGVQQVLDNIQRAGRRLKANVNFGLTMELLLLSMKEAAR